MTNVRNPRSVDDSGARELLVADPSRPVVLLDTDDLAELTFRTTVAVAVVNNPPEVFVHGSRMARISGSGKGAILEPLNAARLRNHLARNVHFERPTKDGSKAAKPPMEVVTNLLAEPSWPFLPPVDRMVSSPVFGPDGAMQTEPGYHPATKCIYAPPTGFILPQIPLHPSPEDIARSVELIRDELLGDFPFVSGADLANTLALLILPFVRNMIDGVAPLHVIDAPAPGTGKSLLAKVVGAVFVGQEPGVETQAGTDDEWRKKIGAVLSRGPAYWVWDNLHGKIGSSHLAALLTTTLWEDRRLGYNDEVIHFPNRTAWVATANNPTFSPELTRRIVPINLDTGLEKPFDRDPAQFRHPHLLRWVHDNRPDLVAATLTLCQAWITTGRPRGDRTMGGYEAWAEVTGGILAVAGVEGFLDNLGDFRDRVDTEGSQLDDFVSAWAEKHDNHIVGASDLLPLLNGVPDFLELGSGNEQSRVTKLGHRLVDFENRVVGDHRIERTKDQAGGHRYRVVPVNQS